MKLKKIIINEVKNKKTIIGKFNLKRMLKGAFIRNVLTVASGAAIAQLIVILFSPLITRIYGPEAFGVLGVFVALTSTIAPIVALTYPMAMVLPKTDEEAKRLAKLSIYIGMFISLIIAIILGLFGREILTILNMEVLIPFMMIIPIFLFFSSGLQVIDNWIIRKKLFRIKANVSVLQALVINSGKVGIGLFHPLGFVLIILTTIGQILSIILLSLGAKKVLSKDNKSEKIVTESKVSLKPTAKTHLDFPIYRAPEMFISGITQNFPVLILTMAFGPAASGFYVIGRRVLSMPAQIIGKAVGDVFYPRIVEAAQSKERITKLIIKATFSLAAVGLFPFGVIIIFGPWLFSLVFGANWDMAGEYARWIALWTYFMFMNKPAVRTLAVISQQKFHLIFTNISLVVRLGMLLIGAYLFKNDIMAIALYGIAGAILNIVLISLIIDKSRVYDENNMNTE